MIHLLYDRVDRDSASITEHPIRSWPTIYRGFGREEEARKRGRRRRGEKIRSGIFRGSGTDRRIVSVLFLSAGDGAEIAFYGGRFDLDLLFPPRFRGIGGSFRIATTEFDRSFVHSFVGSFGRSTDPARRVRETRLIVYTMQIEYPLNDSLDPIDLEIGYKR